MLGTVGELSGPQGMPGAAMTHVEDHGGEGLPAPGAMGRGQAAEDLVNDLFVASTGHIVPGGGTLWVARGTPAF